MEQQEKRYFIKKVWFVVFSVAVFWTVLLTGVFVYIFIHQKASAFESAQKQAVSSFEKDLVYRQWASKHGGVYVPVTEQSPPSPYLSHIKERDLTTPSGRKLTLINPAYMTRQVHELGFQQYGLRGHITSLNPINPNNTADLWEKEALKRFEQNREAISSVEQIDGQSYLRYMRAMVTEEGCLKCHQSQGYKVDDLRGGISISVPLKPFMAVSREHLTFVLIGLLGVWGTGIMGIMIAGRIVSKYVHEQLKHSEECISLSKFVIENPNPVIRLSKDGDIMFSNQPGMQLLSYWKSEVSGKAPKKWKKLAIDAFESMKFKEEEEEEEDGNIFSVSIIPIKETDYINLYARNITRQRQVEQEKLFMETHLRQSQKMEAIGTLAGGIAHDFNNILGGLMGYILLAKDDIPEGMRAYQNLQEALISGKRAVKLVKQILTFSRKEEVELEPTHMNAAVQEALNLLRSSLPTTIEIRQEIHGTRPIMAHETHIHQVLLNLGTNAAHAMENGGTLEVSLTEVNVDSEIIICDRKLPQGPYVKLSVKDTGCGMSKEVQARIFEPFYTTKDVGEGTGLGLSVVKGIVDTHKGIITVDSTPGAGTTFELFFPCVEDVAIKESQELKIVYGQREQILFVDDEKSLVEMATQMLTRMGYEVVALTNSLEALEVFQADPDRFDLVITDQTIPEMTGTELAKELLSIRPEIPILLCTGYSETVNEESAKALGIKELIMKPVNREDMSQIIRELLNKKRVTA